MTILLGTILLALAMALQAAPPVKLPEIYPPANDVKVDHHVAVPMRDGVTLYADIYRPVKDGKYPVLVSRTPYSTERAPSAYEEPLFFARRIRVRLPGRPRAPRVRG
jgi:predicted acyl esterase